MASSGPNTVKGPFYDPKKYNIAVVGQAASGKSSLLNSMLAQLGGDTSNPAATGVVQTTMSQTAYPAGDTTVLIDCPGCGTPSFPFETYIKDFHLEEMDAVIILNNQRITDIDLKLYNALNGSGVKVFVAHNKIDMDVEASLKPLLEESGKRSIQELPVDTVKGVVDEVKQKVKDNYKKEGVANVFLISGFYFQYPLQTYPPCTSFDELDFIAAVTTAAASHRATRTQ